MTTASLATTSCLPTLSWAAMANLKPELLKSKTCTICYLDFSQENDRFALSDLNCESFNYTACKHEFCEGCYKAAVSIHITERNLGKLRCLHEHCKVLIYDHDVKRLVDKADYEKYKEYKQNDFGARIDDLYNNTDKDTILFRRFLEGSNCLPCPQCNVLILKNSGCNLVSCICMTQICFKCRKEHVNGSCRCPKSSSSRRPLYCWLCQVENSHEAPECPTQCHEWESYCIFCTKIHFPHLPCAIADRSNASPSTTPTILCQSCGNPGHFFCLDSNSTLPTKKRRRQKRNVMTKA